MWKRPSTTTLPLYWARLIVWPSMVCSVKFGAGSPTLKKPLAWAAAASTPTSRLASTIRLRCFMSVPPSLQPHLITAKKSSAIASDQPALLQIIPVDLDVGLAAALPAGEESLDVLADEIGFQVYGITHLLDPERRDLGRVRNDGDAESSIGHLVQGQADPVDRDRSFRH